MRVLLLASLLLTVACGAPYQSSLLKPERAAPRLPAPASVIAAATTSIRRLIGDSLYAELVTPRPDWTESHSAVAGCDSGCLWPWFTSYYTVFFSFRPSTPSIPEATIVVVIDTAGRPIPGFPPVGAPHCADDPRQCSFPISADSAIAIAAAAGLPTGVEPWSVTFEWLQQPRVGDCRRCGPFWWMRQRGWPTYGWEVMAFTVSSQWYSRGEFLVIDAHSGQVLYRDSITVRS